MSRIDSLTQIRVRLTHVTTQVSPTSLERIRQAWAGVPMVQQASELGRRIDTQERACGDETGHRSGQGIALQIEDVWDPYQRSDGCFLRQRIGVQECVCARISAIEEKAQCLMSCCKRSCRSWDRSNRKGKHADELVGCFHQNSEQAK
jgi:hypothetical protein